MRRFALLLALLFLPVDAIAASSTWYAQRISGGDTPFRVEHFWSKGRMVRMETVIRAQPFVTYVEGEYYTVVDPVARKGLAIRRNASAIKIDRDRSGERPFATDATRLIEAGAEKVGSEKVAGRMCNHYRATNKLARSEAWVTDDKYQIPLRVVRFDRTTNATFREDFLDWARELKLPDAFFKPEAGIAIERIEYKAYLERDRASATLMPVLLEDLLHGRE